jgi:tetratricopeptide (TPR) repeat protein
MIDFDLEAPGLTHFQDKQIEAGRSCEQLGLVDAIDDFLDDPWGSPLGDAEPKGFFDTYVSPLDVPEGVQSPELESGKLDLVPAGRLDKDYEGRMYDLNFEEMFEEGVGRPLFERLKDLIADSGRYDYILIDSRTGFSDEGSICTRFLADYLLVLTGLNHQNVRGTARFLDRSNVVEREETLALVASPVPMYYEDLRAERIDAAKAHISERAGLDEVRFVTQIPYHPVLALEEDPTVRSLEGTDLFESYEEITERLRTWAGDRPEDRVERVLDLVEDGEQNKALSVFHDVRIEDPEVAVEFLRRSSRLIADNYPESTALLLEEGIEASAEIGELSAKRVFLAYLAGIHINQAEVERAIALRRNALEVNQEIDDVRGEAIDLRALSAYYSYRGDIDRAIESCKKSLDLFREIGDRSGETEALNGVGFYLIEKGDTKSAIDFLEEARDIAEEIDEKSRLIYPLANIGICYARNGNEKEALTSLERATVNASEINNSFYQAGVLLDRALALSHIDPHRAFSSLRDDWSLIQEHLSGFEKMRAHVLRSRLRLKVGNDAEGAAEDAQKALDFYRKGDVDSRWSREAEELLEKAQTRAE